MISFRLATKPIFSFMKANLVAYVCYDLQYFYFFLFFEFGLKQLYTLYFDKFRK